MRITERDTRLLKDLALSHVLSRDQILSLGYFGSVTRANTRLRELKQQRLVRVLETPFSTQSLYVPESRAASLLGSRIAALFSARSKSPRFLQHALAVTNVRITLAARTNAEWRFEQQLRVSFPYAGQLFEVRPDGALIAPDKMTLVEVDLGHVAHAKFREKLLSYEAFITSGASAAHYRHPSFQLLVVTTSTQRAAALNRQKPAGCSYELRCIPASSLAISFPGSWS